MPASRNGDWLISPTISSSESPAHLRRQFDPESGLALIRW
jgi:hypothetical protein